MKHLTCALVVASAVAMTAPASAQLRVVATLPDLGAIAKEVGGSGVTVDVFVNHSEDPHHTDARPSHIVKLNRADLLVFNGAELEIGWLPPLVVQSRNPEIQAGSPGHFKASNHVSLTDQQEVDRAHGDIHPSGNPHFTIDPRSGAKIATALAQRMAALDPSGADGYLNRGAALAKSLNTFGEEQRARFAKLDASKRRLVTYHASMAYLLDWLGLEAVATVEPKPGIAPTPAHTARVLKLMKSSGINVILQESFYPRTTSQTLCKLSGAQLVVTDGGTRFNDGQTYKQHLQGIADALYNALSR